MGKLLLILFSPPLQSQNAKTVFELASTAVDMGHDVKVFCDIDAVYNLLLDQVPSKSLPSRKFRELINKGIQVLICRESARIRGLDIKKTCPEGIIESNLGKLAELMEQSDKVIALGR